jgi:hypothetical protein
VCFEKHSLGVNCPSEKTIMTKDHKIYYKGQMRRARMFLGYFKNVKKVEYNGEYLYNVLLEEYGKMSINNLICETLHPNNAIAKLYGTSLGDRYIDKMVYMMNNCILEKNYPAYNKIVTRLL